MPDEEQNAQSVSHHPDVPSTAKYPSPRVLLVNMSNEVTKVLTDEGYNVSIGSFGVPYHVPKSDNYTPVICNEEMPRFLSEEEVVVIDLAMPPFASGPTGEKHTTNQERDWWASCSEGFVDPRPRAMAQNHKTFDRILDHGGIFIVFASPRYRQDVVWMSANEIGHTRHGMYQSLSHDPEIPFDNWCFLELLSSRGAPGLQTEDAEVRQLVLPDSEGDFREAINRILPRYLKGAHSECILKPSDWLRRRWGTLITDKYQRAVGGFIVPEDERRGWVFVFPQLHNKPQFLSVLFKDILPNLSPELFPHIEGAKWVHRDEYELPSVMALRLQIETLKKETQEREELLQKSVEAEREANSFLYDLIRETDKPLVVAVRRALEVLGFESVIDVDEQMEAAGDTGPRDEDLQIHDDSPVLLVEVKGIGRCPSDEEALTVQKYLFPRAREWARTDVKGLTVINHERHLPGLDRQKHPFRDKVLENAEKYEIGLLTAWDLFRLTRNYIKNQWAPENVKPLFYKNGRIKPVPEHYEFIGRVGAFIEKLNVIGVQIESESLNPGDRIAFEFAIDFEEQDITTLQVDNADVETAPVGSLAGTKTHLTKEQAKLGVRVFRLRPACGSVSPVHEPSTQPACIETETLGGNDGT